MSKIIRAFKSPLLVFDFILRKMSHMGWIDNDHIFIRLHYFFTMHKRLNLKRPESFNEKLQWLKLHDRRPEYTAMVDKVEAKEYVARQIGSQYIIPTLGVWEHFEEIDFALLPDKFVLKCTHDSGGLVICSDKSKLNRDAARKKILKSLRSNYYLEHREYPYKDIRPRIIAEKFMVDESGTELKDYKFFCFNGKVRMLFIATGRPHDTRFDFFDRDFNHLPFTQGHPQADKTPVKPTGYEEMIRLATILSQGMPHVRVDFYDINGKVYFGELTFFHYSGTVPFNPVEWDYKIGDWLQLPIHTGKK